MQNNLFYNTTVPANAADFPVRIRGSKEELIAYLVLILWPTHLAIPLLLLIFTLSTRCKRHMTLLNMFITWIVSGVNAGLLLYTGTAIGPEPLMLVCYIQASVISGTQPMLSASAFMLIYQMHSQIRTAFRGLPAKKDTALRITIVGGYQRDRDTNSMLIKMLATPYICFLGFAIIGAINGAARPQNLSRDRRFFYCSLFGNRLTGIASLFSAALLLSSLFFTIRILLMVRSRWAALLRSTGKSFIEFGLVLRIIIFGFYAGGISSIQLFSISSPSTPIPDLVFATTPTVVFLMFGSQADVRRAVCFWKKDPPSPHSRSTSFISTDLVEKSDIDFTPAVWSNITPEGSWEKVEPPPPHALP